MFVLPECPKCNSAYTYEDANCIVCAECGYEWTLESNTKNLVRKEQLTPR